MIVEGSDQVDTKGGMKGIPKSSQDTQVSGNRKSTRIIEYRCKQRTILSQITVLLVASSFAVHNATRMTHLHWLGGLPNP